MSPYLHTYLLCIYCNLSAVIYLLLHIFSLPDLSLLCTATYARPVTSTKTYRHVSVCARCNMHRALHLFIYFLLVYLIVDLCIYVSMYMYLIRFLDRLPRYCDQAWCWC